MVKLQKFIEQHYNKDVEEINISSKSADIWFEMEEISVRGRTLDLSAYTRLKKLKIDASGLVSGIKELTLHNPELIGLVISNNNELEKLNIAEDDFTTSESSEEEQEEMVEEAVEVPPKNSYQVLNKQLSPETIQRTLDYFDKVDKKLSSYQRKVRKGTKIVKGLETGSPILTRAGKFADTVNHYVEISGLDTVKAAGDLSEYAKSRRLGNKGQTIDEVLQIIREKVAGAKKVFKHINDIQQQKTRQEKYVEIQHPMNDFELEEEKAQARKDEQLSEGWDLISKETIQKELQPQRKISGLVKTESRLKGNLLEAISDINDYKSQEVSSKKDSIVLQYAQKGQGVFKIADSKVKGLTLELDTIKKLVRTVQKQLDYSLAKKGLGKARLDDEQLKKDLEKLINNIEKHQEYSRTLLNNPYGYKCEKEVLVFEEEIEGKKKQKAKPFAGGGAAFLNIQPNKLIVNDLNKELITAYRVIKDQPQELDKKDITRILERLLELDFFQDLQKREVIANHANLENFYQLEPQQKVIYLGIDCTGESLHIGHLFLLIQTIRFAKEGFTILLVLGGATSKIGDPSDKLKERPQLEAKKLNQYYLSIKDQITQIVIRPPISENKKEIDFAPLELFYADNPQLLINIYQ
ncbi:7139_t:CDS:2, partial [Ambispora gerdemannii]